MTETQRNKSVPLVYLLVGVALTAAIAFLGGVFFANATDSPHNNDNFQLFWQSWDILEDEYYYDLPENKELVYGAIQGLMRSAGDHYTFFVPPTAAEFDRQATAGEFGGIGAYVGQNEDGYLVVISPFEGLPAEEVGIQADDIILAVDGELIQGWTQDQAIALLRGKIGTKVILTIYRPSEEREFTAEITRARVELPTVDARMFDNVGYVRLFSFNDKATTLLEREITDLQTGNGLDGLILDLRGNPGGLLDQAVGVSDLFLDSGIVVTQRARDGKEVEYRSTDGSIAENIPLIVLVDGGSASASEVVAGALRDRGRATLIGQTTYGKGSVQHVHDLYDGSQLHVTVSLWFTPNETPIQGQGLEPDVGVETQTDNASATLDPYIEAALDYIDKQGL